ncbi:hypothetical protein [Brevibacillus gelatini]|nr:hypothetical protein [Brevibacillus gelatini]
MTDGWKNGRCEDCEKDNLEVMYSYIMSKWACSQCIEIFDETFKDMKLE